MTEKKKIKLLLDAHVFDHSFQGTATYILGLYKELVKFDDLDITVCAENIEKLKGLFTDERFNFSQLPKSSSLSRLCYHFPRIIKNGNFDYAHFQYVVPLIKSCKFINTVHDILFLKFKQYFPWSYRISRQIMFKSSALRSDIVLTVSEYSKKEIVENFKIDPNHIVVTPNAVDIHNDNENNNNVSPRQSKYILYVSRFEPRKNHNGLLKAYIALKLYEQNYDLVLVGSKKAEIEQKSFKEFESLVPDNIKDRVIYREHLNWADLNALYSNASCFVFPSFAEGFGIPPIEAALNGCKVLCSDQTAMNDFFFFKYRFNPYNQNEFEKQLRKILDDENYPFKAIKTEINNTYNWGAIANKFHKAITENAK